MEVATDECKTPIKQDTKKGKLRDYPYNIHWNYGMLPQTWEDPQHANAALDGVKGDNDPLDVVEIGAQAHPTGAVVAVKALGVFAMIDDGELDWKVIAISASDARAAQDAVVAKATIPEGVTLEHVIMEGGPGAALMEAAKSVELLVIGSRGHGGFAGLLLGSVGQQLTGHAACPVVVVPTAKH